jgi:signal transduction histidine kinase
LTLASPEETGDTISAETLLKKLKSNLGSRSKAASSGLVRGGPRRRRSSARQVVDSAADASEALEFEDLLAELSATFVRLPPEQVDQELTQWLLRIGLFLKIDRSTLAQVNSANGEVLVTHQWAREGVRENPIGLKTAQVMPWLTGRILAGELTVLSSEMDLPAEAVKDLEWGRLVGFKSLVQVPFKIGGVIVGAITFGAILRERTWSPRIVQRLRLVAEVFGGALERQRSTAEIRRLTAEMRHISGVAMMGELTASLAHELNQPLGAVLNNARAARRLLAAKKPDLGEIGEALDDIVRDNSRAVATIRQLRSLFQRGEMQTQPVDIQNIFRDIDRIVGADARERKIDLRVDVAPPLPIVFGDRTQLTQAVLNLVNNAFDSICAVDDGPREVVLRAGGGEAGRLRVAVCDSGEGIDSKIMPRLFDPFFTTKSTGMGMGLAIVRTIVETHGGHLQALQNPGRGATLEFVLPAASSIAAGN